MRKWVIVLMATFLVGCSQSVSPIEETEHLQATLKAMPEKIEEKTSFYIHDELMPTYGMLSDYPSEALIDWDMETGLETDEWLSFQLVKSENIRSVELFTQGVNQVEIDINGQVMVYHINKSHQIIDFNEQRFSNLVKIRALEGSIRDVHISYDLQVDEETYGVFQEMNQDLQTLESYDWSSEPLEAFNTLNKVYDDFTLSEVEILSKDIDINRLMVIDRGIGCPYSLIGKVVSVELKDQYYEVTVDTIIDHVEVLVYSKKVYSENDIFQEHCILIDKNNMMKFITIH
ncbi:hypothetical protein EZV73_08385 [Acidaminobacter sp. JC074]|uniref:hypothetical protein n=1 Tax=Acidaminobacter sp. JC074 TaxID=2530199 RepID=UPI001F1154DD|nr:hypothetical protein [Acidaminobacter sp. JC074]MCH4887587.1 hypothetical protein [Acidaminobacter sp. JC074]